MPPLSHRIIERLPTPAYVTGIIAALCCVGFYLWVASDAGLIADSIAGRVSSTELRASLTLMLLLGYIPVAHWYLRRWTQQCLNNLASRYELNYTANYLTETKLLPYACLGFLAFVSLFLILPDPNNNLFKPSQWSLIYLTIVIGISSVGWHIGKFGFEMIHSSIVVSNFAKTLPNLSLLDTDAHRPFTQQGVRSALLIVIMISITSTIAVQPGAGLVGAVIFSSTMTLVAIISLIVPMRGIHKRIQAQKQSELNILRAKIEIAKIQLLDSSGRTPNADRLTALVTMETRIERISEWPFDVSSLSRVMLYLFLGLGSWVGAALVEKALEQAL